MGVPRSQRTPPSRVLVRRRARGHGACSTALLCMRGRSWIWTNRYASPTSRQASAEGVFPRAPRLSLSQKTLRLRPFVCYVHMDDAGSGRVPAVRTQARTSRWSTAGLLASPLWRRRSRPTGSWRSSLVRKGGRGTPGRRPRGAAKALQGPRALRRNRPAPARPGRASRGTCPLLSHARDPAPTSAAVSRSTGALRQ